MNFEQHSTTWFDVISVVSLEKNKLNDSFALVLAAKANAAEPKLMQQEWIKIVDTIKSQLKHCSNIVHIVIQWHVNR